MSDLIRLPRRFVDDHADRDLDTPVFVKESARFVWIRPDDPALPELVSDAEYYVADAGWNDCVVTLRRSAARVLEILAQREIA